MGHTLNHQIKIVKKIEMQKIEMQLKAPQNNEEECFKACVHYFLRKFYFSPHDSLWKTMKVAFYFI